MKNWYATLTTTKLNPKKQCFITYNSVNIENIKVYEDENLIKTDEHDVSLPQNYGKCLLLFKIYLFSLQATLLVSVSLLSLTYLVSVDSNNDIDSPDPHANIVVIQMILISGLIVIAILVAAIAYFTFRLWCRIRSPYDKFEDTDPNINIEESQQGI